MTFAIDVKVNIGRKIAGRKVPAAMKHRTFDQIGAIIKN